MDCVKPPLDAHAYEDAPARQPSHSIKGRVFPGGRRAGPADNGALHPSIRTWGTASLLGPIRALTSKGYHTSTTKWP